MAELENLIGRVLNGTYRLERKLGEGGMGAVYLARHLRTGRAHAAKVLAPSLSLKRSALARFRREAETVAGLGHAGIVSIQDFAESEDGLSYIIMDLLDGEDLDARIKRHPEGLPWSEAVAIVAQVGDALAMAHANHVVHRDLKPANIFLAVQPGAPVRAILLDFGLAKVMGDTPALTQLTETGLVLGTPQYMSPEQANGYTVDYRTDIYALGVVFYEMLCGTPPFDAPTVPSLFAQLLTAEPEPPSRRSGRPLPPATDAVIARALAKEPSARFDHVLHFVEAICSLAAPSGPVEQAALAAGFTNNGPISRPPASTAGSSSAGPYSTGTNSETAAFAQTAAVAPQGTLPATSIPREDAWNSAPRVGHQLSIGDAPSPSQGISGPQLQAVPEQSPKRSGLSRVALITAVLLFTTVLIGSSGAIAAFFIITAREDRAAATTNPPEASVASTFSQAAAPSDETPDSMTPGDQADAESSVRAPGAMGDVQLPANVGAASDAGVGEAHAADASGPTTSEANPTARRGRPANSNAQRNRPRRPRPARPTTPPSNEPPPAPARPANPSQTPPPYPGGPPANDPVARAAEHMGRGDFRACLRELESANETARVLGTRMSCARSAGDRAALAATCRRLRELYPQHGYTRACQSLLRLQ